MNENDEIVGIVLEGNIDEIIIREKQGAKIELGELLVADDVLLTVTDIVSSTLLDKNNLLRFSGEYLHGVLENIDDAIFDRKIRFFNIVKAKCLLDLSPLKSENSGEPKIPKRVPKVLSDVRRALPHHFDFLKRDKKDAVYVGKIRSGSKVLDRPVFLPLQPYTVEDLISHHVLITATTGRGKSNFVKVMIASILENEKCGIIVFDPHDEYYGHSGKGLKDLPLRKNNLLYVTRKNERGAIKLLINLKDVKPQHLLEVGEFSEAQEQAMYLYYVNYGEEWIKKLFDPNVSPPSGVEHKTIEVLKRKIKRYTGVDYSEKNGKFICRSVFVEDGGEKVIKTICDEIEHGKKVIIDSSLLDSTTEFLVQMIIAENIFERYRYYKENNKLVEKPTVGIVIEEAPRVLSKNDNNVFCRIAREGRKFKLGLIAITQIVESIPYDILANMNTKIILGIEVKGEKEKIVSSCAQDLSSEQAAIASLEKGEAIISSIFTKFPIPVYIEKFENYIELIKEKG